MIEIPMKLKKKLPPEIKMDYNLIDVKLIDGTIRKNVIVRGDSVIIGIKTDNKTASLDFKTEDIIDIRKASNVMRLFRMW